MTKRIKDNYIKIDSMKMIFYTNSSLVGRLMATIMGQDITLIKEKTYSLDDVTTIKAMFEDKSKCVLHTKGNLKEIATFIIANDSNDVTIVDSTAESNTGIWSINSKLPLTWTMTPPYIISTNSTPSITNSGQIMYRSTDLTTINNDSSNLPAIK